MNRELFIVGDVQGCHQELVDLLDAARFDPARHQLVFVGDLIGVPDKAEARENQPFEKDADHEYLHQSREVDEEEAPELSVPATGAGREHEQAIEQERRGQRDWEGKQHRHFE